MLVPVDGLGRALADVLGDDERRAELGRAALARARTLTWDASALGSCGCSIAVTAFTDPPAPIASGS